jgi:rubrerythrin
MVGNHDIALPLHREYPFSEILMEGMKLRHDRDVLFLFHGHQSSSFQARFSVLVGLSLRYVARPLGIKNYSVSRSRLRKYRTERRVYSFSQGDRIASVVGHTHRPLFESLSKVDSLRFRIEQLCRQYTQAHARQRRRLSEDILRHKVELEQIYSRKGEPKNRRSVYNSKLLIPCLFNSGCCPTAIARTEQIEYCKDMASAKKTTYVDMRQFMDLAIQFEVESADFYARMKDAVTEEAVRELLAVLEAEENDHVRILKEFESAGDSDIILQFAPELSLSMPVPGENPDFEEMLTVAIRRERVSADIYGRASELTLGGFKELLEGLKAFEEEHERKLRQLQRSRT